MVILSFHLNEMLVHSLHLNMIAKPIHLFSTRPKCRERKQVERRGASQSLHKSSLELDRTFFAEHTTTQLLCNFGSSFADAWPVASCSHLIFDGGLLDTMTGQLLLDLVERKPEAFHVMPDLNKAIHDFDGEGSSHEAGAWLKSICFMAVLHGWPDSFRLENARLHMKGTARFWLQARVEDLTTWEDFKAAFRKTFVGQTSTAEK
ncbi:hypothetical protein HPB47_023644 [Ixodes persulcatus]|uniref:Uncharacterized protein n=1 Tax=Ixodes persulcatus TaxID=34615 RepID=A0AC60Q6F6_IXOPE|nr:hypothetical protein HPB47_023644 [Ixodes persulcatus]